MWLFVLFDLPVVTKEQRREYVHFRKKVMSLGFAKLQYSVYAKCLPTEDAGEHLKARLQAALPPEGQVRLLAVTDRQFGKMEVFHGRRRGRIEAQPSQIMLF